MSDDDNAYEARLRARMQAQRMRAQHLTFDQSCHSVAEAALAAGVTEQDFVKTICLSSKAGRVVAIVVNGEDRANRQAAQQALGLGKLSIASPREMLVRTGYPAGGTPPFGFDAVFLIDERVLEMSVVYAGGGSKKSTHPHRAGRARAGECRSGRYLASYCRNDTTVGVRSNILKPSGIKMIVAHRM